MWGYVALAFIGAFIMLSIYARSRPEVVFGMIASHPRSLSNVVQAYVNPPLYMLFGGAILI